MTWWQWYLALSFGIGLILAICDWVFLYKNPNKPERIDYDMEQAIEEGHIQREVFGERIVLHPKDTEGQLLMDATNFSKYLEQKQVVLFFLIGVLYATATWPYLLYYYVRHYFFTAD